VSSERRAASVPLELDTYALERRSQMEQRVFVDRATATAISSLYFVGLEP
jgi:hypothetical protein